MRNILRKNRLTLLMLLTVLIGGSFIPILSMYLKDYLNFSGQQTGLIMSMSVVAAFVSPIVSIFVVDRVIARKHFLSICFLLNSILLFALSFQKEFLSFIIIYTLAMIASAPTMGILQAIIFDNLDDKEGKGGFGRVRLWGASGWITASWIFGFFWIGNFGVGRLPDTFRFAGFFSLVVCFYLIFLKDTNRSKPKSRESLFAKDNWKIVLNKKMLAVILFFLIASLLNYYHFFGAAPFLKQLSIKDAYIMPLMTIANIVEVITLSRLTFLQNKFNYKQLFMIGSFLQICSFTIFALFSNTILVILGLIIQGMIFALVIPLIIIYADSLFEKKTRTIMHQLLTLVAQIGGFLANNIGGIIMDNMKVNNEVNYFYFWFFPIILVISGFFLISIIFAKPKTKLVACPEKCG